MPLSMLLAAAIAVTSPTAVADTPINTHDTLVFERQLREIGYQIEPFKQGENTASTFARIGQKQLAIVLGGCTKGTACVYVALVSAYSDVLDPPSAWVMQMNSEYDLIKVWKRDSDNALSYSAAAVVDGMPRATFRRWIDKVEESGNDLAAKAVAAGFNSK